MFAINRVRRVQRAHCSRIFAVCLGLLSLSIIRPVDAKNKTLVMAAAEIRVGQFETALRLLDTLSSNDSLSSSAAVIRTRAALGLGRMAVARAALGQIRGRDLRVVRRWLAFRIAYVTGRTEEVIRLGAKVMDDEGVPKARRQRAALSWAEASLQLGRRKSAARRTLKTLAQSANDRSLRAAAWSVLAGKGDKKALQSLLVDYPASPQARTHLLAVDTLLSTEDLRLTRAENLFKLRAYTLAQSDFLWLQKSANPEVKQRAQLRLGTIRMRMRNDYEQSAAWLDSARNGPDEKLALDADYRYGIALGYLGRYRAASKVMAEVSVRARGRRARNARYQVGRLLHEAGHFREAVDKHQDFLKSKPRDREKWTWFLGWSQFRGGSCHGAERVFSTLMDHPNLLIGPKSLYWQARCHRIRRDMRAADRYLSQLRRRAPLSYYGLHGSALSGTLPKRQFKRLIVDEIGRLGPWMSKLGSGLRRLLKRIRLLSRVGYVDFARALFTQRIQKQLRRRLGRKRYAKALGDLAPILETWGQDWKRQHRRVKRRPWRHQFTALSPEQMMAAYPPAYAVLARAAGRAYDVSPWWLMAHMLQESRYKERARSHAHAIGLMQILPRTGRRITERIGFPKPIFWDDDLYDPGIALRQAAWYLDALRREYRGNVILAMAAYNGGPRRVSEHLGIVGELPFDMMIEEMGAHETRNYARKVTDHLIRYLELYADDEERKRGLESLLPPNLLPVPRGEITF